MDFETGCIDGFYWFCYGLKFILKFKADIEIKNITKQNKEKLKKDKSKSV